MQRMRVPAGHLTPEQWRAVADMAERLTPGEPLHLTTRQDIELHGLTAETVPQAEQLLSAAGLSTVSACGDTVRNVTVCPHSGTGPQYPDLAPLAAQIEQLLLEQPGAYSLPRKFKISLSACPQGCAQPFINDIAFVAVAEDGGWRFRVVIAGSLGAKPETGIELPQRLEASEVVPMVLAAFRLFAAHGDRQSRARARLRHVRQRLGNEEFLRLLNEELERVRGERQWPQVTVAPAAGVNLPAERRVAFVNGDITPGQARAIAALAERDELRLRITNWHYLAVFGRDVATIDAALAEVGLQAARGAIIVSCPGTRWCSRGLASTQQMAVALERALEHVEGDLLIALSGCPNGCAQTMVADIGLTGLAQGPADRRQEVWTVVAGGGRGQDGRLAQPVAERLSAEEAVATVRELLEKRIGVSGG